MVIPGFLSPAARLAALSLSFALVASAGVLGATAGSAQPELLGSIEGTVTDAESGEPIAGMYVVGFAVDGSERSIYGFTDDAGRFVLVQNTPDELPGVTPGGYILLTGNTDMWASVYAAKWWLDSRDSGHADVVEVREGEVAVADFELELGGRIIGRVVDANSGLPIEDVEVTYLVASPRPLAGSSQASSTAADGTFEIAGLSALGYKVCFQADGYRAECWRDAYLSAGPGGGDTPGDILEVSLGETIELEADLTPGSFAGWFWDDDWSEFQRDIDWLAGESIARGCNPPVNDRFCPEMPVTRGHLAALFHRAFPDLETDAAKAFDDLDPVFAADIRWLSSAGITRGCNPPDNTRFCPGASLTRGQAAAMLVRALDLEGATTDRFTDDDESEFESEIEALAAAGITRGCSPPTNDRYCPAAAVTRAELAAFIHRALVGVGG